MTRLLLPLLALVAISFTLSATPLPVNPFRGDEPPVTLAEPEGDVEFRKGIFREAATWYAGVAAVDPKLLDEKQNDAWAFSRVKLAAESVSRPVCDAKAAEAAEKDVLAALQLAPKNAEVQKLGQSVLLLARTKTCGPREPVAEVTASGDVIETASFTVRLPTQAPPQSDRTLARGAGSQPVLDPATESRLADVHVLVLDDEEDMRDLISMILEHAGARVTRVNTVDAALKALSADLPHVAVSDLAMPGEDGYAFVRRVRAASDATVRSLPLVAMTAYARAEDRHRVLEAGFQRHVAKPIEPMELVEALAEVAAAGRPSPGDSGS